MSEDKIKACCKNCDWFSEDDDLQNVSYCGLRGASVLAYNDDFCSDYDGDGQRPNQRIAELKAENKRLSDAWELAANENNTLRLHRSEFVPLVESDFENDRNEVIRGVFYSTSV